MSTAILDLGKRANMRRTKNFPKLNNRSEFSWDDRMNNQSGLGVAVFQKEDGEEGNHSQTVPGKDENYLISDS